MAAFAGFVRPLGMAGIGMASRAIIAPLTCQLAKLCQRLGRFRMGVLVGFD